MIRVMNTGTFELEWMTRQVFEDHYNGFGWIEVPADFVVRRPEYSATDTLHLL